MGAILIWGYAGTKRLKTPALYYYLVNVIKLIKNFQAQNIS
jgi:hypothetical protein